jgi:hypothetical protein
MPDGELFEFPVTLSPRLAWMRLHGVDVIRSAAPQPGAVWFCRRAGMDPTNTVGAGDTDNDAIYDWCEKTGIKHWSLNE